MINYFVTVILLVIFVSCKGVVDTPSAVFLGTLLSLFILVRIKDYLNTYTMKKPKNLIYEGLEENYREPAKIQYEMIVVSIFSIIVICLVLYVFFSFWM